MKYERIHTCFIRIFLNRISVFCQQEKANVGKKHIYDLKILLYEMKYNIDPKLIYLSKLGKLLFL